VAWIVRLVGIGAEGEEHSTDVLRIARPGNLADLASQGLTLAGVQRFCQISRQTAARQQSMYCLRRSSSHLVAD
jgi:hypothetical protein